MDQVAGLPEGFEVDQPNDGGLPPGFEVDRSPQSFGDNPYPMSENDVDLAKAAFPSIGKVLRAFGEGFGEGFGPDKLGLSPESEQWLRDKKIIPTGDDAGNPMLPFKAFNDFLARAVADTVDLTMRAAAGAFRGTQAAIAQAGEELHQPVLGRDIAAMPEAFFGTPHPLGIPKVAKELPKGAAEEIAANLPPAGEKGLVQARDLGVVGPPKEEPAAGVPASELAEQAMPRDLSAARTPPAERGEPPLGHKPGEYDARGKEWIDKIDEPDDVRAAIEGIANDHDFFPQARGGVASAAARDAVAEAAGLDPASIDREHFATHFDNDGKVRAVIQALRQTGQDFADAAKVARENPSVENAAALEEARMRHTHVLEYTMGIRAESGRSLAAWKDLLRETEHAKAQTALKEGETTGKVTPGTAGVVDAAKEVERNLKDPKAKKLGLQKLVDQAKALVEQHDKPADPAAPRAPLTPELQGLVDEARKALKRFGEGEGDAAEVDAFKAQLERLTAGTGKLGDTLEAARDLLKKNEKPKKEAAPPKAPEERGKLLGAAKRLVAAANSLPPEAKGPPISAEMQGLMETTRQAVGRLKTQNAYPDLAELRRALADGDAKAAQAAAKRLVAEEAKVAPNAPKPPIEHNVVMAAARRLAEADIEPKAGEKPALPPDIVNLLAETKAAVKELSAAEKSVLDKLIASAERQAKDMVGTRAVKNPVEALPPELQALVDKTQRVTDRFGGIARGERAAMLLARTGRTAAEQEQLARSVAGMTPNQVAKVLEKIRSSPDATKPGWFYWLWQQGLISGLITHTGYAITNTATVMMERILSPTVAAAFGKMRGQDISIMAPIHSATAMVHSLPDAFEAAGQAFKTGTRVPLASEMRLFERGEESPQTKGATFALAPQGPEWGIWKRVFNEDQLDAAARALGIPGRAANLMHTFFKVLSERAAASTIAYDAAAKDGVTGDRFWQRYQHHLDNPTDDALKQAVNDAYSGAFMSRLGPKTEQAAQALKNNPASKWIFPFAHIPWNIARMGVEYSPMAVFGPEMRAALRGEKGAPAQNLAIAKMAVGTSIITYFAHKALAGEATGDYPTDPAERRRWELLRIQPQSIQIGGEWVNMQRLGPVGIVAHMGASLGTIIHHYDGQDDDAMTSAIWSGAVASANIFADNFQGLKNLFEAMNSEKKGGAFASSFAGSFVPSLVGQAASVIDPNMRKAEGLIDGLRYRVPWLRESILPKRDPLYGEPVENPGYRSIFRAGTVNTDPVKAELDRLQFYPLAPRDTIGTVKLPPHLYDEYQILAGANVHMLLDHMVTRPGWQDIPPGVRTQVIRSVISAAREKAAAVIQVRHQEVIQRGIENRMDTINGLKPKKLREPEPAQ